MTRRRVEAQKGPLPVPRMDDEEDEPVALTSLSASTLAALRSVLAEQELAEQAATCADPFSTENWGLSQFHYDSLTASTVARAVAALGSRVACVSCPTLFRVLKDSHPGVACHLLEFDSRYDCRGDFTLYDYNAPLDVPAELQQSFDCVVADPPYLSAECLSKTAQTVRLLATPEAHRVLLTGAVMRQVALRELGVRPVVFRPQHCSKLANEFLCYVSDEKAASCDGLGGWDPEFLALEEEGAD
jgi:hypothetical protein